MINHSTLQPHRTGFSIIEVLTSIVVAMIGVFGVMVLIPFAVKQAQTGLDSDAATIVARNAYDQFEIAGFRNDSNWIVLDPMTGNLTTANTLNPQPYSIDPLGVTENQALPPALPGTPDYVGTTFPFNADPPLPAGLPPLPNYRIPVANLRLPVSGVIPMTKADARRMFRAADDLVFGEAIESAPAAGDAQLNGPQPVFDEAGAPNPIPMRRQSVGRLSWSAIVVPEQDTNLTSTSAWKYRMYMLVYKDRVTDVTDPKSQMLTAQVASPAPASAPPPGTPLPPVSTVELLAGTIIPEGAIRKDDWVMMVNRPKEMPPGTPLTGFQWQIGFYRVVNYNGFPTAQLTLDGPDFDFNTNGNEATYIVHLKNIVGVYERSFTPEGASNWNLTF